MRLAFVLAIAAACGDNLAAPSDARIDAMSDAAPPDAFGVDSLFDTGLCVDAACTQISADVHPYTPRWALWADGATKLRWYQLPPNGTIDTTDMDHWVFPVGTKFWKEFDGLDGSGNNVRVETRFIEHVANTGGENDWYYVPFQWNATEDGTTAVPNGASNADGTMHDIPSRVDCKTCHDDLQPTRILGFGAIQLDEATPAAGDTALADLIAAGALSAPPAGSGSPYFPMQATGVTADALGYLHANCGHCHNPTSMVFGAQTTVSFRLEVATLGDTAMTPTYLSAVNQMTNMVVDGHNLVVDPGMPGMSVLIDRFEAMPGTPLHMPALATKVTDPTGDATLTSWITGL
ncbi:MAG TPA: hypothetical protein VH143_10720 [Kofleriaceae bacterium]|nr:hypothetical protein [Kofleriaceae bacterium]